MSIHRNFMAMRFRAEKAAEFYTNKFNGRMQKQSSYQNRQDVLSKYTIKLIIVSFLNVVHKNCIQ